MSNQQELLMKAISLSDIARIFKWKLIGEDMLIQKFGNISSRTEHPEKQITYVNDDRYLSVFAASKVGACIVHKSVENELLNNRSFLIVDKNPEVAFYELFNYCLSQRRFQNLITTVGQNVTISPNASIHENVIIGNNVVIMDNVVIFPNTIIGDDVVIKPNSVIGSDGFQVKIINDKKRVVQHVGGVGICDNVEIGANVCVDKGLFGEYTIIGKNTKLDNQIHISHSVVLGENCTVTAGTIIAGCTNIGDNVWIAPNCTINQLLDIGSNVFIGSGTVVTSSLPDHVQAFGAPGRIIAFVCKCRSKLHFEDQKAYCNSCDIHYKLEDKKVVLDV
jgi:UDP-3-O-[3-hydroxymyristoyl] glucosamine N-acyltransferase